jgi:alcohol dehydrogenase (cytochrome c)
VLCLFGTLALRAQQPAPPQVTFEDLLAGLKDGTKWLTYSGTYDGHRHSPLTQIAPANVHQLTTQWTFQTGVLGSFQATPIVIDGVIYVTGFQNNAWAIDARSGRQIWRYRRDLPDQLHLCCGPVNRGMAVLGDRLFMTTVDAHLLALDMATGTVMYDVTLEDYKKGYSATVAPLVVKDKVILGIAGAEYGIRGFIEAFDAATGKKIWRFNTVAGPDEFGGNSWPGTDAYLRGGGSIWVTGTYDPESNLVFFGTGNPGPDYYSANREGDNLFTASIVALDADTGKLKWHYQFTPHDVHDWDATQVPVLAELPIDGKPRKVVMFANRNGFFYTIDRATGKLIVAKPFVETTWAKEISSVTGRPILLPNNHPNEQGTKTCPDLGGGTNFMSVLRDRARDVRHVFRLRPGIQGRDSVDGRRHGAAARPEELGRPPRHRSDHRRTQMGVPVSDDVGVGGAVNGVRLGVCRRRRREPARARVEDREEPVALPAGVGIAEHVGHDLHAGRPTVFIGPRGEHAHRICVAGDPIEANRKS